jgi:ribonuclease VapC
MVIDTSAILAIFLGEPERQAFLELLRQSDRRLLSAGNALETAIALEARRGASVTRELDLFIYRTRVDIVPVDAEQVEVARVAWRMYGKGHHPAGINFGYCFAYALARTSGERSMRNGRRGYRTLTRSSCPDLH